MVCAGGRAATCSAFAVFRGHSVRRVHGCAQTEGGSSVVPPPATKTLTFLVNFQDERYPGNETGLYAFVNNVSLVTTPYSPSLLERLSNNPEGLGEPANNARMGWQIITLNEGDTVDVIINNEDLGGRAWLARVRACVQGCQRSHWMGAFCC